MIPLDRRALMPHAAGLGAGGLFGLAFEAAAQGARGIWGLIDAMTEASIKS